MKNIKRSLIASMILASGAFILVGCASLKPATITIGRPAPLPPGDVSGTMAGAARADITPPPGLPLAGHSLMGKIAEGVRTRLYARVLYLKPKTGRPVVLIQADLLSGSRILHHRVAELIASRTDVEAGGLVIAGTHTHSAQGNYFGEALFDRMASSQPGFQRQLYEFMARKIADAVVRAYENRRPAKVATGSTNIIGMIRNRSLPAYHRNRSLGDLRPGELEAVNPELRMIRVDCLADSGAYVPIAAFSNFSMHPNLTNEETDLLYNGDVTAYAEREVEWGIKKRYPEAADPVHAIASHVHGDITPDYGRDEKLGYPAMRRIGTVIGQRCLELFDTLGKSLSADAVIRYRYSEIDVYQLRNIDGESLCEKPALGQAQTAGATDRPTPLLKSLPGFAPGWPKKNPGGSCQGAKRVVAEAIQYKLFPLDQFPHVLFLQAVQIHDTVIFPVPFEVTTMAGRQMAERCDAAAKKAGLADSRFIVMSTSNSYWGYCTTADEYSLQYYEGGSTLYGPGTSGYLAAHLARLTGDLSRGSGGTLAPAWTFNVVEGKNFFPPDVAPRGTRKLVAAPALRQAGRTNAEPYWHFRWQDLSPAGVSFDESLVTIETSDDLVTWVPLVIDSVPVDDRGYDIAVICTRAKNGEGMGVYEARWYNPATAAGKLYRFKILPRAGLAAFYSPAFR